MLPTAAVGRTYQQTLSGTPTAPAIGATDVDYAELWVSCTAAFNFRFQASDPGFPLLANTVYRIPCQRTIGILFDGSGTLTIAAMGYGGRAGA